MADRAEIAEREVARLREAGRAFLDATEKKWAIETNIMIEMQMGDERDVAEAKAWKDAFLAFKAALDEGSGA